MTVKNFIPKEIEPYVWFKSNGELEHTEDMPSEYEEMFQTAKKRAKEVREERIRLIKRMAK